MENGVAKRAKVATSRAEGQASTIPAGGSGSVAMTTREQPAPPKSQQYSPKELLLPEHQSRMESRLRNLDFSDILALDQYHGATAMFENTAPKYYGRK